MPFLLHKDTVLTEETAANDYQKWLNDDADAEQEGEECSSFRNGLVQVPLQDNPRFETCG